MITTKYKLSNFDYNKVYQGILCAIVKDASNDDIINNTDIEIVGIGVCQVKTQGNFLIVIDGVEYTFNSTGEGTSNNASNCRLAFAEIKDNIFNAGNAIGISEKKVTTKSADGSVTIEIKDEASIIDIDTLNARDQFAIQILTSMMRYIENPFNLSNNEMSFYCNSAYQWAANMMTTAAKTRTTIEEEKADEE